MTRSETRSHSVVDVLFGLFSIPLNFLTGLITGLAAPVVAIAGIVLGIRLITGRFPFLSRVEQDSSGERQIQLRLVPPEQVRPLWEEHKRVFGAELGRLRAEIQAISEQSRSRKG